jgi:hypothetical protein
MIWAKRSFVKCRDWFIGISHFELLFVYHHPSVSLNKEKICREISENKIAFCEKTQGLRSGNFSDLNSACSTVLVPVKIFQFQDMLHENRFLSTFRGHSKRPIDRFHLTSRRPYWCTKTMKWRPYWCTVRELALSYSNISYCFTTPLGPPITWVKTIYMGHML